MRLYAALVGAFVLVWACIAGVDWHLIEHLRRALQHVE